MEHKHTQYYHIKNLFSFISVGLLLPLLAGGNTEYYRTFFIFLINEVLDLLYNDQDDQSLFMQIWSFVNRGLGTLACVVSFCLMSTDFYNWLVTLSYIHIVNVGLIVVALSFALRDLMYVMLLSLNESRVVRTIREKIYEKNKLGGKTE